MKGFIRVPSMRQMEQLIFLLGIIVHIELEYLINRMINVK